MIRSALVMFAVFLLLHLLGGRDSVGMLSGTMEGGQSSLLFGLAYALSWFTAVLVVPVLLLAGLAHVALGRRLLAPPPGGTMKPGEEHPWSASSARPGSPSARSTREK